MDINVADYAHITDYGEELDLAAYQLMDDTRNKTERDFFAAIGGSTPGAWLGSSRMKMIHASLLLKGKTAGMNENHHVLRSEDQQKFMDILDSTMEEVELQGHRAVQRHNFGITYDLVNTKWYRTGNLEDDKMLYFFEIVITWEWNVHLPAADWESKFRIEKIYLKETFESDALPLMAYALDRYLPGHSDTRTWSHWPTGGVSEAGSIVSARKPGSRRLLAQYQDSRLLALSLSAARLDRVTALELTSREDQKDQGTDSATFMVPWSEDDPLRLAHPYHMSDDEAGSSANAVIERTTASRIIFM